MTRGLPIVAPLLLLLSACGPREAGGIELSNAWARPTAGQAPAAVYLTIENKGGTADRLTGAYTDQAALAMVHQNDIIDGVARMRMAGEINLPAGDQIDMVPGGTHIMLEGLRAPLKTGEKFDLVLRFRDNKDQTVEVTVRQPEGQ